MATRLGTSLAALLGRFATPAKQPRLTLITTPPPAPVSLQDHFSRRTTELLKADEAEHERVCAEAQLNAAVPEPVSERNRCPALSDVVTGWPCRLKNGHAHSFQHDWEIGGAR